MIPDFTGKVIEIVRIDLALFLWTTDGWEISLAGPVHVLTDTGTMTELEVGIPSIPLPDELAGLEGASVAALQVSRDGDLGLTLAGRQLSVRASPDYEAWEVSGPDGEMLVCQRGGHLAYYPPTPGSAVAADTPE